MTYSVKSIFYTLQGEGANAGRPAVFCRFAGCNLWSGYEEDRSSATCNFCDTDFVGTDGPGGGKFGSAIELSKAIRNKLPRTIRDCRTFVVFTGGEPLLQLDQRLVDDLHKHGCEVAVETNGTLLPPAGIDWICVSPKANSELKLTYGNELKLVYPQPEVEPHQYEDLNFSYFYLQPCDGPEVKNNIELVIRYVMEHPRWRMSCQTHKFLGIS
jgi:7-carboxy-7-deazaguanine synthase